MILIQWKCHCNKSWFPKWSGLVRFELGDGAPGFTPTACKTYTRCCLPCIHRLVTSRVAQNPLASWLAKVKHCDQDVVVLAQSRGDGDGDWRITREVGSIAGGVVTMHGQHRHLCYYPVMRHNLAYDDVVVGKGLNPV